MTTSLSRPQRVLYIHHAGLGGSALSLYYTVTALDRERWEPVVALIKPAGPVVDLYREAGIECIEWPGIRTFEHTTANHMRWWWPPDWARGVALVTTLGQSVRRTGELIEQVKPDIVHLNAVVLGPSALAVRAWGGAWIWHVREQPVRGVFGIRTAALGRALANWPEQVIFLSEGDRRAWVGGRTGVVVHNYVDLDRFKPGIPDERAALGIAPDDPVVAYIGGISAVKGIMPLLDALAILRQEFPHLRCLMPGTVYQQSETLMARTARRLLPLVGSGTLAQRAFRKIDALNSTCVRLPFRRDIAPVLASADVVAFPAIRAHFPRPAVEAAALGKPVVASRFPGIDEVVQDGETGLLTAPGEASALAEGIRRLLLDPEMRRTMGENGRQRAERLFDQRRQVAAITDIYEKVLSG